MALVAGAGLISDALSFIMRARCDTALRSGQRPGRRFCLRIVPNRFAADVLSRLARRSGTRRGLFRWMEPCTTMRLAPSSR